MAQKSKPQSDAVTINLQPFIQPAANIFSALIIAGSILISGGRATTVTQTVAGAATTTPTAAPPAAAATVDINSIKNLYNGDYIKFGDANRKLLFVEVADPSCPYCHIAGGKNSELNKSAGAQFTLVADGGTYVAPVEEMHKLVDSGQASYIYLYYPGHGQGEMGMRALYCGYEAGKFWEVHDLIMSAGGYDLQNNQVKNDKTKSQQVADFLKGVIDPGFMKSCLDSGRYDSRLSSESSTALTLGITGTPGFFLNATRFDGAYSWTDMAATANAALQ